jgi:hypothetical protein
MRPTRVDATDGEHEGRDEEQAVDEVREDGGSDATWVTTATKKHHQGVSSQDLVLLK